MKKTVQTLVSSALLAMVVALASSAINPIIVNALTLTFDGLHGSINSLATGTSAQVDFLSIDRFYGTIQLDLTIENPTSGNYLHDRHFTAEDEVETVGATQSRLIGFGLYLANSDLADIFNITRSSYTGNSIFGNLLFDDDSIDGSAANGTMAGTSFNDISFDLGFGNKSTLIGNGNSNSALGAGESTTVSLILDPTEALDASGVENYFLQGFENGDLIAAARFKAVNAGVGSDKLFGGTDEVPVFEPITAELPVIETPVDIQQPNEKPEVVSVPEPIITAAFGIFAAANILGVGKKKKKNLTLG